MGDAPGAGADPQPTATPSEFDLPRPRSAREHVGDAEPMILGLIPEPEPEPAAEPSGEPEPQREPEPEKADGAPVETERSAEWTEALFEESPDPAAPHPGDQEPTGSAAAVTESRPDVVRPHSEVAEHPEVVPQTEIAPHQKADAPSQGSHQDPQAGLQSDVAEQSEVAHPQSQAGNEPQPHAGRQPQPDTHVQSQAGYQPQPDTSGQSQAGYEPQPESYRQSQAGYRPQPESYTQSQAGYQPQPQTYAQPHGQPQPQTYAQPQEYVQPQQPVGAWWPDYSGRFEQRWHDGVAWTAYVSTQGAVYTDPFGV